VRHFLEKQLGHFGGTSVDAAVIRPAVRQRSGVELARGFA